jgi:phosphoglycerol transferase MdoB-like AlkP superfamily enzyme
MIIFVKIIFHQNSYLLLRNHFLRSNILIELTDYFCTALKFRIIENLQNINKILKFTLGIFLFWMGLFTVQQIIFLLFNAGVVKNISFGATLAGFWFALGLNISSACYLTIIPFIISMTGLMLRHHVVCFKIARTFTSVMLVIVLMIGFFDLGLYDNWGTKINSKAISFLVYPKEMMEIIFNATYLLYFVLLILLSTALIWLFRKAVRRPEEFHLPILLSIPVLLIGIGSMFILMRGGFQTYPISKRSCYYSKHSVLNYAALNGFWNLVNTLARGQVKENPYRFYDKAEAEEVVHQLYLTEKDSTTSIFKIEKPNIAILMMESISADAIACLGGEKGIMPEFDKLAAQGLLFKNFYSTGFRTDQGIVAVLSSFPAQPATAIIKDFGKFEKLPNLVAKVGQLGYNTSFYYGGDISYANTATYLTSAGIEYLAGVNEVPHTRKTDWGAYDEDLFSFYISDSLHRPEPFLSVMLTLTNHEYFDADVEKVFNRKEKNNGYLNTAHYTDKCIAQFIRESSTKAWYKNTVFIITSDHAHILPLGRNYNEPGRHHIPFLIFGEPLKPEYRGKIIEKTASHLDITPTLLAQLKLDHDQFRYGKDLFNPFTQGFAYYAFDNGFGFINDQRKVVYDYNLGKVISCSDTTGKDDCKEAERQGKAFLEVLFQEYIDL